MSAPGPVSPLRWPAISAGTRAWSPSTGTATSSTRQPYGWPISGSGRTWSAGQVRRLGDHGPFERIFVSYTVQRIPSTLVRLLAPRGRLLVHVTTASPSWPGLAVVERTAQGTVRGALRAVEFAHRAGHGVDRIWLTEELRHRIATEPGTRRFASARDMPSVGDRGFWLAADHLLSGLVRDFGAEHLAIGAPGCGSWLRTVPVGPGWEVAADGPRDIWAELQGLADRWREAGSPHCYRLDITEDGCQRVSSPCGALAWQLPVPRPVAEGVIS